MCRAVSGRFSRSLIDISLFAAGCLTEVEAQMDIQVGDILKMKKPHPCGSKDWEVLRIGADFRLKCAGCGHQIMIARRRAEKNIKEISKKPLANC